MNLELEVNLYDKFISLINYAKEYEIKFSIRLLA